MRIPSAGVKKERVPCGYLRLRLDPAVLDDRAPRLGTVPPVGALLRLRVDAFTRRPGLFLEAALAGFLLVVLRAVLLRVLLAVVRLVVPLVLRLAVLLAGAVLLRLRAPLGAPAARLRVVPVLAAGRLFLAPALRFAAMRRPQDHLYI